MPSSASSTTPCGAVGCCTLAFSTEVTELPHLTLRQYPFQTTLFPLELFGHYRENDKASWKNTLSRQQGVYVITNTDNGKRYVGSATGRNGIYQRWQELNIRDGHGNDTGLIAIVKQHALEYVQAHFLCDTLLEHYDFTVPKDVVLARESYWKETLDTRKHGYNGN